MAAIGAAHVALDERREGREHPFRGFGPLEAALRVHTNGQRALPPLGPAPRAATCCFGFTAPGLNAAGSLSVRPEEQGAVAGLLSAAPTVGMTFGPLLCGIVYSAAPNAPPCSTSHLWRATMPPSSSRRI